MSMKSASLWHYDGVASAVKRLATKASLQRLYNKQLLSAEVIACRKEGIKGIEFIFILQADVEITRMSLQLRYTIAKLYKEHAASISLFHNSIVYSTSCIGVRRVSVDENYVLLFTFLFNPVCESIALSVNSFGVCLYDGENVLI